MNLMKISTAQFYRSSTDQMVRSQSEVAQLQTKLGSGKQLNTPSDDPQKSNAIARLEGALERQSIYQKNIDAAQTRLSSEETVLTSMNQVMQRVSELTIQAASDTLGAEDRAILAIEIDALKDELFGLVNSKDLNGNYLFSGNKIDSPAFVRNGDGVVSYNGDYGRLVVNVSDVREVALNTLGTEVFSVDEFRTLDSLVDSLVANDGGAVRASIDSLNTISERLAQSYAAMAGRVSALESQKAVLDDTSLRIEKILMSERDLDYATAVTELTKESVALQALQASFSKLAQLSLFNFLR